MDGRIVSDALDKQEWLDPVSHKMQDAIGAVIRPDTPAGKTVEDALNGVWFGHPLHTALVTVPIGAWSVGAALDVMEAAGRKELGPGADAAIAMGTVSALGAAVTGAVQWYPLKEKTVRHVGATHAILNVTATALFAGSLLARKQGNRGVGRALGWAGLGINLASAWLGGSLSYDHKVGVDHAPRGKELPTENFVPVLADAELPQNQLTRAQADGVPVVLLRRGETIHALAATCAHFGGPLDEGKLEEGPHGEGPCVRCPWHGSCFSLTDGQIVDGPSTYPQPLFDARVRNGQIEVRAKDAVQNMA